MNSSTELLEQILSVLNLTIIKNSKGVISPKCYTFGKSKRNWYVNSLRLIDNFFSTEVPSEYVPSSLKWSRKAFNSSSV